MLNASLPPSDRAAENLNNSIFGVRSGFDSEHYALKLAIRSGFIQFDKVYET
jgi:hypothetical protein